jgi:hypothetical protein
VHSSVYAADELLSHYRRTPADATEADSRAFRRLLREHIGVYAHDPRRARFIDKTQPNTVRAAFVDALLSGCDPHFVLVTRNPYAWCHRAVRRKPPSYTVDLPYVEQLRLVAEHWANSFRLALEDAQRIRNFTVVRYEDFLAAPEAVVRALCDSVGLSFSADLVPAPGQRAPFATLPGDTKWYPLRADGWLAQVTAQDVEIVAERCGEIAGRLGYAAPGALGRDGPVLAGRPSVARA